MEELKIECPFRDLTDIEYGYIYCLNPTVESMFCYLSDEND